MTGVEPASPRTTVFETAVYTIPPHHQISPGIEPEPHAPKACMQPLQHETIFLLEKENK